MALTQISTKGIKDGTITGSDLATNVDLVDDQKLRIGTGNDLEFFHNGTRSEIKNSNVNNFTIRQGFGGNGFMFIHADKLQLRSHSTNHQYVSCYNNGQVELYHNNTKKFETTSDGIDVDGSITCNDLVTAGAVLHEGDTNTLVHFDANDQISLKTNGSTRLQVVNAGINVTGNIELSTHLDMPDNAIIKLGTGDDLQIYHDGSNSYITDTATGNLNIGGSVVHILNPTSTEILAKFTTDGAAELYYDNSKKLETTSAGATVTGDLLVSAGVKATTNYAGDDNVKLKLGTGDDMQIFHDGSNSRIHDGGTGVLAISGSEVHIQNAAQSENCAKFIQDGAVELYFNNAQIFRTEAQGIVVSGNTRLPFDNHKILLGASQDLQIYHDGTHSIIEETQNGNLVLKTNQTGTYATIVLQAGEENSVICHKNGNVELYFDQSKKFETTSAGVTVTGALTATGDVTAFSDETLKKDITTIENAIDICSKLRGVSYKWIKDDKASIGVIAQEVEKVIPEVVHTTEHEGAEVKSVDYGKIIGVLINAINEQQAKWDEWMELLKEIKKMEDKLIEVIGSY